VVLKRRLSAHATVLTPIFYYRAPDRSRFDRVSDGSINTNNIPAADGEALVASINANLVDKDGAPISLIAEPNVAAGRQTFDECQ